MAQNQMEDQDFSGEKGALIPFLKRLFRYSARNRKWFGFFMISVIGIGIIDGLWPLVWKNFLDFGVIPEMERLAEAKEAGTTYIADFGNIWYYGSWFLILGILSVIAVHVFVLMAGYLKEQVLYDLREEMFVKLQQMSFSYFDKSQSGWLLSRITSDADKVCALISWGFLDFTYGITMILACLISMFYFNWKLALVVALSIPILMFISLKLRLLVLKYSRKSRKINSEIIANYTEHINGVEVNKITAQEERVSDDFAGVTERMRKVTFRTGLFTAMYMPLVIFMGSLAAVVVIYLGGNMVLATVGGITIGTFAAFFRYATRIFDPILEITHFYAFAQNSLSAGERIFGLIDETIEINDVKAKGEFESIKGNVSFKNVDFYYVEDKPVLKDFNLQVKAGESIALVGPSGEGKSTIVNLIARFYEPKAGAILIDGIDYQTKSLHSFRQALGVVHQTPHLFSGTIAENVAYAKPKASKAEIIAALKMVAADALIPKMEEEVGEGGERLSMGEQQLISFARAVLADPAILIMDEATSSIDTLAEAKIQKGVEKLLEGRTSFIIAHRLSTIKNCDRILVIQKGKVFEEGSHRDLMLKKGKYFDLYTKQIRQEKSSELSYVD